MAPQHRVPISKRLVEFVRHDLPDPSETDSYLSVLKFAQMAWNVAVLPPGSKALDPVTEGLLRMPPDIRASFQERLSLLVERKKRMFPDDTRVIVEVRLKDRAREVVVEASHYDLKDEGRKKTAEPGATDNPDDAQRLREDL